MFPFRFPFLVVLLLLAAPLPALPDDPPATRLPELVVTATAEPAPATDVPVHVQVVSREEIERTGAETLDQVLIRRHPGVFYKVPGSTSVGIRGFRSAGFGGGPDIRNRTLILIDGHRAGIGNISLIPTDNVERIEVVRGPGSVLYGASAIGGVINVITRKGDGPPTVVAGAEYGSFGHTLLRGGYSAATEDDRFGLAVAGRAFSRDDYGIGGSGPTLENSAYKDNALSLGMRFDPVPGHRLSASGSSFTAEAGAPGSLTFPSAEDSTEEFHRYASLSYDGAYPDGNVTWRASAYHAFHEYDYISPFWGLNVTETTTQGGRVQLTLPTFAIGRLTLGGESERIKVRHEESAFSPDTGYDIHALFAEERLTLDRLVLYLGARYDWFRERTLETAGLDVTPDRETFAHASWRGGAVFDAAEWLSLRVAVGTGFRPPVAEELTGEFITPFGTTFRGNPDLNAETSVTYETGLDLFWRRFSAGGTLFHTRSRDTIVTEVVTPFVLNTYRNIDGITLTGFEGYAEYVHRFKRFGGNATVTPYLNWIYYLGRKNEDQETAIQYETRTPFYIPELSVTSGALLQWKERIGLDLNAVHTGSQKVQNFELSGPPSLDKGSFTIVFASLRYRPVDHLGLSLRVENLLDKRYEFVDGYPMPGRTVIAGVELSF
jgi:vitamin B12 transporter